MAKKKTSTVSTRLFVATMIFLFLLSISALCILASTFQVTINYSMNSSWITFIFVVFLLSLTCAILLLVTIKKGKEKANQKPKPEKPKPEKPKPEKPSSESGNNNAVPTTEKTGEVNETNSPDDDDDSDDDDDAIMQLFSSEISVKDSVIVRMNQNLVKMKEYYDWSQDQAKVMFIVATGICIAGFGLIVASLLLSIFLKLNFEAALFTAIGGMVTEVFGGTILLVYRSSVTQLSHFHKSLHEDQRYLFTAELAKVVNSTIIKDEMLEAIIRNALRINLVLAQEKEETEEKKTPATAENEKPVTSDAGGQTTASNSSTSTEETKKP